MIPIRSIDDIRTLEADGLAALCPHGSPHKILAASAREWPQRTAIHYLADAANPSQDQRWSYARLFADVQAAARVFRANGVSAEKSVAILANHTPLAQIALWGAQVAGRACPINPMLRPEHIAALFDAADVAVAVVMGSNREQDYWQTLVPALREAGVEVPILDAEGDRPAAGSDGCFEALCAAEDDAPFPDGRGDEALAAMYHTGGTTGTPKLVRHTRHNEAHVARSCAAMYGLESGDRLVNGFPLFHVAGAFVYGLAAFAAGAQLVMPGRLGMRDTAFVGSIWQQVARCGVTVIGGVPTIVGALAAIPVDADITTLRLMLTGGSPLPGELADAFERATGKPVRNILGMTESAGCISVEPFHGPRTPGSCGLALPFTEVRAVAEGDADATPLPAGVAGILATRGPNVSPGYSDPAIGRETFPGAGWLVTGDIGQVDADGRIFITGRAKDVIIRGAHNLDPQAIEEALLAHPAVESAAAVGMPDSHAGELPVAFVQLKAGATVDVAALEAHARAHIDEPAAMPKRIEAIDTMPLTPIGKIFKPALRREATRWALQAAAARAGLVLADDAIEVSDAMACVVRVPAGHEDAMRDATRGMALEIAIRAG